MNWSQAPQVCKRTSSRRGLAAGPAFFLAILLLVGCGRAGPTPEPPTATRIAAAPTRSPSRTPVPSTATKLPATVTPPPTPTHILPTENDFRGFVACLDPETGAWLGGFRTDSLEPVSLAVRADGSIVVELGNAWEPGRPVQSLLHLQSLIDFVENVIEARNLVEQRKSAFRKVIEDAEAV